MARDSLTPSKSSLIRSSLEARSRDRDDLATPGWVGNSLDKREQWKSWKPHLFIGQKKYEVKEKWKKSSDRLGKNIHDFETVAAIT